MKKACFAILAVLLAMAMISCDGFAPAGDQSNVEYIDGKPFINLTINTGSPSRALTDALARGLADYYEVAFEAGGDIYRTSWAKGKTGSIRLPPGDYTGAANAIMLAGNEADGTLLAVGIISEVDGSDVTAGTADITVNTKTITFTLYPFETNVEAATTSGFLITGTGTTGTNATEYPTTSAIVGTFPTFADPEGPVPLFLIPKNASDDIKATFAVTLAGGALFTDYDDGLYVVADGTIETDIVTTPKTPYGNTVEITMTNPTMGDPFDGNIAFDIGTPNVDFYNKIYFEIPINAINTVASVDGVEPLSWFVRGGTENRLYDRGAGLNSVGGAILLGVGNVSEITINSQYPPPPVPPTPIASADIESVISGAASGVLTLAGVNTVTGDIITALNGFTEFTVGITASLMGPITITLTPASGYAFSGTYTGTQTELTLKLGGSIVNTSLAPSYETINAIGVTVIGGNLVIEITLNP